ncbi:MAG: HAMP domain-containing protein [Geobacter sp.]|nr:HAMP domain-containing protein [Geobacter sp.]
MKMKRLRSSIRFKLTVATLVPLITAIAVCWLVGVSLITTRFYSQAQQSVETNLNSAHEILLGEMARLSDIIRLTGQTAELAQAMSATEKSPLPPPLQLILHNERLSFLTLVDRYGFVRYRAGNPSFTGDSKKKEKLISDALKGVVANGIMLLSAEQAAVENPLLPQQINIPTKQTPHARPYSRRAENRGMFLVAAAPVLAHDGSVSGVLYGGVLMNGDNWLVDRITKVVFERGERLDSSGTAGTATLFLDDIRIATTVLDNNGKRAIGSMMSAEVYDFISRGKKWIGKAFVLDRHNIAAYEPLRDYRGSVVGALYVGVPEQPYKQLHFQINLVLSAVLIFVTLIGVGLSAWFSRRLSLPIKALEEEVRRIAAGEKLPDITVDSNDEIASLADEFNIMKHRLAAREQENLNLNRTLEQKVLERTTQLEETGRELLNAQQELAQAERLAGIGMLASGVAHEINNPLAIIRGNAELLQLSVKPDQSEPDELETILRQVGRIDRIVKNLRSFSRGGLQVVSRFSLAELLDSILDQIGHQMPVEQYRIDRGYRDKILAIEGDEDQLRQVFTNLILNGLQSMTAGGVLALDTACDGTGQYVSVSITDSGCGIRPDSLAKLFTPFFTTKPGGTGLGLAVSYGIIKDHGGEIKVSSEDRQGSVFTVILPLRQTKTN